MQVGIIGRGKVAQALKTALGGLHEVRLGVRSPGDEGEAKIAEVAVWADVVIIATPWGAEEAVAAALADHIAGKAVIDATNPVGVRGGRLDLMTDGAMSAAEGLQARLPRAHVVKTFNQIGAEFMADPTALANRPAMFVAADDDAAREIAITLVRDAGFEALEGGPLAYARHLESLAMLWI